VANPIINSLNAGELSLQLSSRTDVNKYHQGEETLENFLVRPYGGVERRSGLEYIAKGKVTTAMRLVPFIFSQTSAYVLEFGNAYIRFYKGQQAAADALIAETITDFDGSSGNEVIVNIADHGFATGDSIGFQGVTAKCVETEGNSYTITLCDAAGTPDETNTDYFYLNGTDWDDFTHTGAVTGKAVYELVSPYGTSDLFQLQYAQSADVMYLAHPDYPPRILKRTADKEWEIDTVGIINGPYLEANDTATKMIVSFGNASAPAWVTDTAYETGDFVINDSAYYSCTADHTSSADTEPGTGSTWTEYWHEYTAGSYIPKGAPVNIAATAGYTFDSDQIGAKYRISHNRGDTGITETYSETSTTDAIRVKGDWQFITGGTWTGTVEIQRSFNYKRTWSTYRKYESKSNSNFDVSGEENSDDVFYRIVYTHTDGEITINFNVEDPVHNGEVEIDGITSASGGAAEIASYATNCKIHATLNDNSDDNRVFDKSAAANHGTINNGDNDYSSEMHDSPRLGTGAFLFDKAGADDYVDFGNDAGLQTDTFTYAFWVYPIDTPGANYDSLIAWSVGGLPVVMLSQTFKVALGKTNAPLADGDCISNTALTQNAWNFVAVTHDEADNGTCKIYINSSTADITVHPTNQTWIAYGANSLRLGWTNGVLGWFGGKFDNFVMFDSVLESSDIAKLLNETSPGATGKVTRDIYSTNNTPPANDPITDPTDRWAEGAWSSYRGFPRSVCIHQERTYWGGNAYRPDEIWASKVADWHNMQLGSLDDSGLDLTCAGGKINRIQWLLSEESLLVGTSGGIQICSGGDKNDPITPKAKMRAASSVGSAAVQAVLVNGVGLYLQKDGKKLRECGYVYEVDKYETPDATILADHILGDGGVELDYQNSPDSILWSPRADGQLCTYTYEPGQQVGAWARQITYTNAGTTTTRTASVIESVAVIPGDGEDEVWVLVKRVINSSTVRYIERFKPRAFSGIANAFFVDSGVSYSSPGSTTLTGLDHLEGEKVDVLADGVVITGKTVSSGSIDLSGDLEEAPTIACAGLPYTSTLRLTPLFLQMGMTTSVGRIKRIYKLAGYVLKSGNVNIGTDTLETKSVTYSATARTYVEAVITDAHDRDKFVKVTVTNPTPCTILSLMPHFEVF